ncbi:MAG: type II and III secretion system protein family protein [Acetobacteraceae bacterium]
MLESGTGRVVSLNGAAANIFVADPKVAEVRPASASSLFLFGIAPGHTTVAAMDSNGHVLAQYDLTVQPSSFGAKAAEAMIARLVPGSSVKVQPQTKGLMLTGSVPSPSDAAQAVAIAKGYGANGDTPIIDNEINITAPIQVTLNVRIAEMSRTVVRNLGINWQALGTLGKWNFMFSTPASLTASAASAALGAAVTSGGGPNTFNANALIDALAQDNLAHVLAEPNLTVMSGQPASFQVGGEYPIPVAEQNGTITIDFKDYGVLLTFLPTVMSDGRINLHVKPEVSELDKADGIQITAGNSTIQIPALTVRRAESTVELGSGQSFAMAGLLQQTTSDNAQGLPGLGDTPILGALFRSNAFQRTEQELVIIVTPYIVRPVDNVAALHVPSQNYTPPTDLERLLLMRQVSDSRPSVPVRIPGDAGFVVQ